MFCVVDCGFTYVEAVEAFSYLGKSRGRRRARTPGPCPAAPCRPHGTGRPLRVPKGPRRKSTPGPPAARGALTRNGVEGDPLRMGPSPRVKPCCGQCPPSADANRLLARSRRIRQRREPIARPRACERPTMRSMWLGPSGTRLAVAGLADCRLQDPAGRGHQAGSQPDPSRGEGRCSGPTGVERLC